MSLEKLNVLELETQEMNEIEGGSWAGWVAMGASVAGAALITTPPGAAIFAVAFIASSIDVALDNR